MSTPENEVKAIETSATSLWSQYKHYATFGVGLALGAFIWHLI